MTSTELRALPRRALRRDHVVFAGAMAMETAHLLDDGLLHPHTGSADVPSAIAALVMGVVAVAIYGRLSVWARAGLAALFGLAGLAGGLDMHVLHALEHGATGSDYTGFGHAFAGLVLLGLAASSGRHPQHVQAISDIAAVLLLIVFGAWLTRYIRDARREEREEREKREKMEKLKREKMEREGEEPVMSPAEREERAKREKAEREERAQTVREAKLTMAQAIQIATNAQAGTVLESILIRERNQPCYKVVVLSGDEPNTTYTIMLISALDGQILLSKTEHEKAQP
jgi:uncharacterized membrane protein YkoI